MDKLLWVGLGGMAGSIARYLVSGWVQEASRSLNFPYGTLAVNVLGCLIIGLLSQLAETRGVFTPEMRLLVFTGVLGGFTTFSTLNNETVNLLRENESLLAGLNVAAHLVFGLLAVWLGRVLAQQIWR